MSIMRQFKTLIHKSHYRLVSEERAPVSLIGPGSLYIQSQQFAPSSC